MNAQEIINESNNTGEKEDIIKTGLPEIYKQKKAELNLTKISQCKKCVICKKIISGYGNNAWPLANGTCCDKCNILVIERRTHIL